MATGGVDRLSGSSARGFDTTAGVRDRVAVATGGVDGLSGSSASTSATAIASPRYAGRIRNGVAATTGRVDGFASTTAVARTRDTRRVWDGIAMAATWDDRLASAGAVDGVGSARPRDGIRAGHAT